MLESSDVRLGTIVEVTYHGKILGVGEIVNIHRITRTNTAHFDVKLPDRTVRTTARRTRVVRRVWIPPHERETLLVYRQIGKGIKLLPRNNAYLWDDAHDLRYWRYPVHKSHRPHVDRAYARMLDTWRAFEHEARAFKDALDRARHSGTVPVDTENQFVQNHVHQYFDTFRSRRGGAHMSGIMDKIEQIWTGMDISGLIDKIRQSDEIDESAVKDILASTFQAAEEQLEDGYQIMDVVPILSAALKDIMKAAEKIEGATGPEKLEFVTALFVGLYDFLDKGVDGDKNRLDIPWVPQVAEDFIEKKILPIAVRFAVEAVVSTWNE